MKSRTVLARRSPKARVQQRKVFMESCGRSNMYKSIAKSSKRDKMMKTKEQH